MKKLSKKIIALIAVATMAMTSLAGCGSVDDSEVVLTVGETEITADMVQFCANYIQPQYEDYALYMIAYQYQMYGLDMDAPEELDWDVEVAEGVTYEEDFKENYVMATLKNLYLAKVHMSEYSVELTEEELAEIEEAAKTFDEANDAEAKEKVSASKELAAEYLKLVTIYQKVEEAILATVDREVDDADAAQKRLRYVEFAKTEANDAGETIELSEEEIATLKTEAENFLEAAKANGSLETYATEQEATAMEENFGADYKDDTALALDDTIYEAADALTEVGFMELQETDDAFYVVQLESLFDEEATETEKESIISQRESDKITEVFEAWEEESKVVINEKVWKKMKFTSLKVTQKEEETKEDADATDDTADGSTDDTSTETTDDASADTTDDTATDTTEE